MYVPIYRVSLVREGTVSVKKQIKVPKTAARVISELTRDSDVEKLVVIWLDTKNCIIGAQTVSVGTINSSIVHPREVFKPAIVHSAASIIMGHNHPSGDCTPSDEDVVITRRIGSAGQMLGIDLLDSIIVGADNEKGDVFISLKELGLM